jgi:hypothetical protein
MHIIAGKNLTLNKTEQELIEDVNFSIEKHGEVKVTSHTINLVFPKDNHPFRNFKEAFAHAINGLQPPASGLDRLNEVATASGLVYDYPEPKGLVTFR